MNTKGRFPFRIGAPSYVLPADMLTNVRYLASRVDDIELLVFESDTMAELPTCQMVDELYHIASGEALTYTVHLPLDIVLGHPEAAERKRSVEKCLRTIDRMKAVSPFGWILHCDRHRPEEMALPDAAWVENITQSLRALLTCGVAPASMCVETLDHYFPLLDEVIHESDVSICLDVGHLLRYGLDCSSYLERYAGGSRVVHVHGVIDGKDHRAISGIPREFLQRVFDTLAADGADRVVTIEVFHAEDLETSLRILEAEVPCRN